MDIITIHLVCNLDIILGLINAEIIVIKDMTIETYPAYDEGTLNSTCIVGRPDPNKESGKPKLMNIKNITTKSKDPIMQIILNILKNYFNIYK